MILTIRNHDCVWICNDPTLKEKHRIQNHENKVRDLVEGENYYSSRNRGECQGFHPFRTYSAPGTHISSPW